MDSPLAKLERPSRTKNRSVTANLPPPENLVLPDGRTFNTRELLRSRTPSQNYNLRGKDPKKPNNSKQINKKYQDQDWIWMLTAGIDEIMKRFEVTNQYAQVLRSKARSINRS